MTTHSNVAVGGPRAAVELAVTIEEQGSGGENSPPLRQIHVAIYLVSSAGRAVIPGWYLLSIGVELVGLCSCTFHACVTLNRE